MSLKDTMRNLLTRRHDTVDASTAARLIDEGALLVDVREAHEWKAGHAPRARHLPLGQLRVRLHELPADTPVVTVCRSGQRSAHAASILAGSGRVASNLAGGMDAWVRAGLPVTAAGGGPGRVV